MLSHGDITLDSDMSDRKSTLPQDSGQLPGVGAPVSLSRRRFAKGAAPVLLGTLASKPVLGAEYICTVSGHASGNASAHATNDLVCDVGNDVTYWLTNDWPGGFVKGGLPDSDNACSFTPAQGTLFKDVTSGGATLANVFFYRSATQTNPCRTVFDLTPSGGQLSRPASLYQVLARTGSGEQFRLGRATVASLLNAASPAISYPISAQRIIEMFNAVKDGSGTYHVDGANLELTRLGVIDYLEKLYS